MAKNQLSYRCQSFPQIQVKINVKDNDHFDINNFSYQNRNNQKS